ncbi:hypothetical protein DFJ58DRAFT_730302 [Suillus subalutaceus]|uniref:uncharacterized protein n=1 Tax=Suillus subalutaceus TaxID=48586 RepID=UPI001B88454A|nr:uncharacterized protein DFJ58DRAFT_730302 [Suillus subalutaceus]KAG1846972.1 hypothetical protein DFJ58DRAFT_730302 [Suillus subalutaceus]
MKRSAPGDHFTPTMRKRSKYDDLQTDQTVDNDELDEDVTQLRSPSPQSIMGRHVREILEMLSRVESQVEYLQEEREEILRAHEKDVERYEDRIDVLDEEVRYQQAVIDVMSNDVDRLEEETAGQKKEIEEFIEQARRDTVARNNRLAALKDQIIGLVENAKL